MILRNNSRSVYVSLQNDSRAPCNKVSSTLYISFLSHCLGTKGKPPTIQYGISSWVHYTTYNISIQVTIGELYHKKITLGVPILRCRMSDFADMGSNSSI